MSNYRRVRASGAMYFFTVVAFQRQPILTTEPVRIALREAIEQVRQERPFSILAWVLLPDHLHCIWQLPEGDSDYSSRWSTIKRLATQAAPPSTALAESKHHRREGALWQRRFWEHLIRDDSDYAAHFDYIHWNHVKHGLVSRVRDWPYSTFHRYAKEGVYPLDWSGAVAPIDGMFGE